MTAQTAIEKLRELMFYTYDDVLLKRDELCKIVAEFDALKAENAALRQNSASMEDTNRRLAGALVEEMVAIPGFNGFEIGKYKDGWLAEIFTKPGYGGTTGQGATAIEAIRAALQELNEEKNDDR